MVADVYDIYERDLHRMNAMDFDDLLFRVVNLLELFEDVRERYRDTFRHVLVDEYQDTNHAQYRLLQLLVGGGRPLSAAMRSPAIAPPTRPGRAPQPGGRGRRRAVPGRGDARHDGGRHAAADRGCVGRRLGASRARERRLSAGHGHAPARGPERVKGSRSQPARAGDRSAPPSTFTSPASSAAEHLSCT